MLYSVLILILLSSSASAVIPLRLVEEIQLPARTVSWDVQHVEDSTSFGWAAVTQGESIWGMDSLGYDSLIAIGVDTIWFQSTLDGSLAQFHFPRTEFNPWQDDLAWARLRILKIPGIEGISATARAIDGWNSTYDQYLYFFHLSGDSVLRRSLIWNNGFDSYSPSDVVAWPVLPSESQRIVMSGSASSHQEYTNCDVSTTDGAGLMIPLSNFTLNGFSVFAFDNFDRSDSNSCAFLSGTIRYIHACEDEDPHYDRRLRVGSVTIGTPTVVYAPDTFHVTGTVVALEDWNGDKRVYFATGNCYNAVTGDPVFNISPVGNAVLSAHVRNAPGEDLLSFQNGRFMVYDGRTGQYVDSMTAVLGTPRYELLSPGFDQIVTYDNTTKVVRVYEPFETLLCIKVNDSGNIELSWNSMDGATLYRLDRGRDSEFLDFDSDYFAPNVNTVELSPAATFEFFRVTPLFE